VLRNLPNVHLIVKSIEYAPIDNDREFEVEWRLLPGMKKGFWNSCRQHLGMESNYGCE